MHKFLLSLLLVPLFFSLSSAQKTASNSVPLIPMEAFFRNAAKSRFSLSPDGQYLSYRADYKGKLNIFVEPAAGGNPVRVTQDTLRSIYNYIWKGGRVVYQQDVGGDENFQIHSVNPDGSDLKPLVALPGYRADLLDEFRFVPGMDQQLLIVLNKRNKEYMDPYLLNVVTGELQLLYENKENFDTWYPDNNGVIRMASKTDGVNLKLYYRPSARDTFAYMLTTTFKETFVPQSFDADNRNVYVLSNIGRDKLELVEFDPAARKEIKVLYARPDYDLSWAEFNRQRKKLSRVVWQGEKNELHYFDSEMGNVMNALRQQFKGYEVNIWTPDDKRSKAIVQIYNERQPGIYYLYDFATRQTRELGSTYPWLNENDLAEMKPVRYKSRDGLTINGYLTLPKGVPARQLPVVINPHGGPWYRDVWGYNPEVQFLANRGYAVLQMNFRGSTGYGRKFWEASFKQWGRTMQDDITDGVQWLIKNGVADPKRVAIYGGSYGGYATLAGITFTPDLYACAVDYVGVANMFTFMKTMPPYWEPYRQMIYELVGHPQKDSLWLAAVSPVMHADRIKAPLFIAQGANDPRVNKAESDQMVEALRKRGVAVEYMVKNDEGHGFANQQNRLDFYGAMERFFARYLGSRQPEFQQVKESKPF